MALGAADRSPRCERHRACSGRTHGCGLTRRLQALAVHLRRELAKQRVGVLDFAHHDLEVGVDGDHHVLARVHIGGQNALLVLVEGVGGPVLHTAIQIPKLDDRVQPARNQPLILAEQCSDLVVVRVEALYHRARKQTEQIDFVVAACKSE